MIPETSLFYPGGTISDKDIIKTKHGLFALNDRFLFIAKSRKHTPAVIPYELNREFTFKILKTKIKIIDKECFKEWLADEFCDCIKRQIFAHYTKN